MFKRRSAPIFQIACAALLGAALVGCGAAAQSTVKQPTATELQSQLKGSPPALNALHSEIGQVQSGGTAEFNRALASVKGYPAVVNVWASWCGPCRYEFPIFGTASGQLGKSIAFLGVTSRDSAASAQKFLDTHPVGYPSWNDESGEIGHSLGVAAGLPATVFFTADGKRSYIHQGPYSTVEDLKRDINRYAEGK